MQTSSWHQLTNRKSLKLIVETLGVLLRGCDCIGFGGVVHVFEVIH